MDKRQEIAAALEDFVQNVQPADQSQVALEKLKAGLSLVVEDQKAKIAEASEDDRTWLEIVKGISPILITGLLGAVVSILTLIYQGKQHDADLRRQKDDAKAAGDREGQELQATEEAKARQDRTALLERLAQAVSSGPVPAASCWYAQGIWADYSKDEPLPQVLAVRCSTTAGSPPGAGIASPGAQWVTVIESDSAIAAACGAADRARRDGLENVQVLREEPAGLFATTAGQFATRPDAVGYLQRVRSVRANAYIARQYPPKWTWVDCSTVDGGS